jgi:hypothetical protein
MYVLSDEMSEIGNKMSEMTKCVIKYLHGEVLLDGPLLVIQLGEFESLGVQLGVEPILDFALLVHVLQVLQAQLVLVV